MNTRPASDTRQINSPFPLRDRFRKGIVPGLAAFVGLSLVLIGLMAGHAVESIYLEMAQRRAQTIEKSVRGSNPEAWAALMSGRSLAELRETEHAVALTDGFANQVRTQDLLELKVYDLTRRVLYATNADEIGTSEDGEALRDVIASSSSGLVTKQLPDGTEQYELYVPVFDDSGNLRAVFELYEPVDYLDRILLEFAIPAIAIPGIFFLLLGITLDQLVRNAQNDIDYRSGLIEELQRRLESFVSATAVDAARNLGAGPQIASRRVCTTLFFSDIRGFTGFSEQHSPEEVVNFLNKAMSLQVEILKEHGGDIDKMIGDAVLARFDGADGADQAIQAARRIQAAAIKEELPRSLGIGVFRGEVISGTIGPENRRDFTVIGDAVNVAARLCSAAGAGEIVVASELADDNFGAEETITVKGREAPVAIRRMLSSAG